MDEIEKVKALSDIEKLKALIGKKEAAKERNRQRTREYYAKKKQDPEWVAMNRERGRDYNLINRAKNNGEDFRKYHREYYHKRKLKLMEAEAKLKELEDQK